MRVPAACVLVRMCRGYSRFIDGRVSLGEGSANRKPHLDIISVICGQITTHSKTSWLRATTSLSFAHDSAIRAGLGRWLLSSREHQLKGLSGPGGAISETVQVHTLGKLHLVVSWGLSRGGKLGVSLTSVGSEL